MNAAAFPIRGFVADASGALSGTTVDAPGLTKREMFAALVMPAVIAAYVEANGHCIGTDHLPRNTTAIAVNIADTLLARLSEPKS